MATDTDSLASEAPAEIVGFDKASHDANKSEGVPSFTKQLESSLQNPAKLQTQQTDKVSTTATATDPLAPKAPAASDGFDALQAAINSKGAVVPSQLEPDKPKPSNDPEDPHFSRILTRRGPRRARRQHVRVFRHPFQLLIILAGTCVIVLATLFGLFPCRPCRVSLPSPGQNGGKHKLRTWNARLAQWMVVRLYKPALIDIVDADAETISFPWPSWVMAPYLFVVVGVAEVAM